MLSGLAVVLALLCGFLVVSIAYMSTSSEGTVSVDPIAAPSPSSVDEGGDVSNGNVSASVNVTDGTSDVTASVDVE